MNDLRMRNPFQDLSCCGLLIVLSSTLVCCGQETSDPTKPHSKITDHEQYRRHHNVVYQKYSDGKELVCDIFVPKGKGPFPSILMIHGGAWRSGTKFHMLGHASSAARQGFVAITINYRHAPHYKWPAQFTDCQNAMRFVLSHAKQYKIDKRNICLWGYSAGGHLATLLATSPERTRQGFPIRCVVCGGGPVDLQMVPQDFPFLRYFLAETRRENPEKYRQASPITHVTRDDPPMFFYHGELDFFVPVEGVKNMIARAKKLGIDCELMIVPGKEHILTFFDAGSYDAGLAFIRKHLER